VINLFDRYVIVDWSATSKPTAGKDSIWIATCGRGGRELLDRNPRTRDAATTLIADYLRESTAGGLSVFIGFDFPYGYPAGFAALASGAVGSSPWRTTWNRINTEVKDDARNSNNRFAVASRFNEVCGLRFGPFWGAPTSRVTDRLSTTGHEWSDLPLRQYRRAERRLIDRDRRVQETWKLWTAGSVGGQALMGIPRVVALRDASEFASISAVWPFETGFASAPFADRRPFVLHAEIWPGVIDLKASPDEVRDQSQVRQLAQHFADLDARGRFGLLFERPAGLPDSQVAECISEEGWILGA